ncbi:MAG: hypothetical protein KC983_08225 [Phycisphaerales bacterium]|nr:hypothetical protein [Phycisphaerales bacterium]
MIDMTAAERKVTLPTAPLLGAAWIAAILATIASALVVYIWKRDVDWVVSALLGGCVVAGASTVALLAIRPWHAKALMTWPMVWVAGSFLRLLVTVAGTFLLYSATRFGTLGLVLAVMAAYFAVQVGESRIYAGSMKRHAPAGAGVDGSSAEDSE